MESEAFWDHFIFLPLVGGLWPTEGKSGLKSCEILRGVNRKTVSFTGNQRWSDASSWTQNDFGSEFKKKKKMFI